MRKIDDPVKIGYAADHLPGVHTLCLYTFEMIKSLEQVDGVPLTHDDLVFRGTRYILVESLEVITQ